LPTVTNLPHMITTKQPRISTFWLANLAFRP
jgi:hypothetical protein